MNHSTPNVHRHGLRMRLSACAASLLLLSTGCTVTSQLQPYQESTDAGAARLRVVSNEIVTITPGRACFDHAGDLGGGVVLGGHATPSDHRGQQLGMPPSPAMADQTASPVGTDRAEIRVAANRPTTLSMRSKVDSAWICNVGVTFTPRVGEDYEASMVADGDQKLCQARVTSLTRPTEPVQQSSARACAPTL